MTDLQSLQERRAVPRFSLSIPIEYETPSGWASLGETFDLSERGLGVKLNQSSKLPSSLRWRSPEAQIQALGKIVWNNSTLGRCGIQTLEIDAHSKNKLNQMLILSELVFSFITSQEFSKDKFFLNEIFPLIQSLNEAMSLALNISEETGVTKIFNILDVIVEKLETQYSQPNQNTLRLKAGKLIRSLVGPWIYQSLIVKRAYEKPRGYPGDHSLLEMIYDRKTISPGEGKFIDWYFLENPYAVAVRNRKDFMKQFLESKDSNENTNSQIYRILNIACGSCREIRELLLNINRHNKKIHFICMDHDEEALSFSKTSIQNIPPPDNFSFNFINENILNLIKYSEHYSSEIGPVDLIYSIGLVDYLPDRILKSLLKVLFSLLAKGGSLLVSHKDIKKYKPLPPNWYCDWHFTPRSENELVELIQASIDAPFNIHVKREPSNIIFFVKIDKL